MTLIQCADHGLANVAALCLHLTSDNGHEWVEQPRHDPDCDDDSCPGCLPSDWACPDCVGLILDPRTGEPSRPRVLACLHCALESREAAMAEAEETE